MIVVTAVEAQNRFGDLIDQAQREPIEITRRGRPVAYVVCEHDHKALQDLNTRREKAVSWYANYRRATATSLEAAALTDADIDRSVHELRFRNERMDFDRASPYIDLEEDNPMATGTSMTHLDTPIGADLHAMLKRAAEIRGVAMADFVVAAVQEAAQRTIAEAEVIRLSLADSERFAAAILSPPPPSPALERAFARRRDLLGGE